MKHKGSYDSVCLPRREGEIIAITTQQSMEELTRRVQTAPFVYRMSNWLKGLETIYNKNYSQDITE